MVCRRMAVGADGDDVWENGGTADRCQPTLWDTVVWVVVGLGLLYLVFFFLLCLLSFCLILSPTEY
jgi:hypothetical protein